MHKRLFIVSASFLVLVWTCHHFVGWARGAAMAGSGARIRAAAVALIESLNEEQKKGLFLDPASDERTNWHFIPRDRKGVPLKNLGEPQREKVLDLLRASLGETGARKAIEVMSLEDILREIEGTERKFPRDPLLYYVSFFGKPSPDDKWAWRLEGHHLSLDFAVKGDSLLTSTPVFFGANPALVKNGPKKGLRILAGSEDIARELVASLKEEQLKSAKGEEVPEEVPGAQAARYPGPLPAGIASEKLTVDQQKTLRRLIREYTQNLSEDAAATIGAGASEDDLKGVHFAWRGGLKAGEGHSYLVHGPSFLINYANYQNGAAHVHSCLRSLKGEFGAEGK